MGGGKGEALLDVARGRLVAWALSERSELEAEVRGKTVTVVSTGTQTQKWHLAD